MKIKQLPIEVANQIAAGEVVERPASVVKELLENALDAGARSIAVEVERGGLRAIVIDDDGCGIDKEEVALAVTPHATSKIVKVDDLFSIKSLGFRGEALASISSVSHFSLCTKRANDTHACRLSIEGKSAVPTITVAARGQGTSVLVRDLFFNVPVRKKFLRSEKTEFAYIDAVVKQIALSRFDVGFKFSHNNKLVFNLPPVSKANSHIRIVKLLGRPFLSHAIQIDEKVGELALDGFLATPDFMRSQNDLQYSYVNGRMVKDKLVNHAIKQAYAPLLFPGRQAAYVLFFSLPENKLDVNVHPTKHEVRFHEPRQVHDFITTRIAKNLHEQEKTKEHSSVVQALQSSPTDIVKLSPYTEPGKASEKNTSKQVMQNTPLFVYLGGHYALLKKEEAYMLLDVKSQYQQCIYDKLIKAYKEETIQRRPLLVPLAITLKKEQVDTLPLTLLERCGLVLTLLDESRLFIREFPVLTPYLNFDKAIPKLAGLLDEKKIIETLSHCAFGSYQLLDENDKKHLAHYVLSQEKLTKGKIKLLKTTDWASLLDA